MPPHLHPRSTATSTLFAGTLLASFVVVAIPHLVPCPRPHGRGQLNSEMQFDENGKPIRKLRRAAPTKPESDSQVNATLMTAPSASLQATKSLQSEAAIFKQLQQEAEVLRADASKGRECPVPKPKGTIGRWLGFESGSGGGGEKEEGYEAKHARNT